ncbi:DUF3168 domain-containing protein [Roseicitreum antarcticum]|uniref:DUF3168 domain-containing protein n=1 Tax=Roseicitreum antarcticum TaxID=564137 RepID=A0A1H2TXL6_9RHOB|nr:DUF3168 domain-containing protein [Roseicitreum antarcticum]SDW48672.1 Protein of unknown function [Roseicitreum antarcticum]
MSYAWAADLQAGVYQALADDVELSALVAGAIFDAPPLNDLPPVFIMLGPEEAQDRSDASGAGAEHRFTVSVVGEGPGFLAAKIVAARVSEVLQGTPPALTAALLPAHLTGLWFERAMAKVDGARRRIDLRYRARVGV